MPRQLFCAVFAGKWWGYVSHLQHLVEGVVLEVFRMCSHLRQILTSHYDIRGVLLEAELQLPTYMYNTCTLRRHVSAIKCDLWTENSISFVKLEHALQPSTKLMFSWFFGCTVFGREKSKFVSTADTRPLREKRYELFFDERVCRLRSTRYVKKEGKKIAPFFISRREYLM